MTIADTRSAPTASNAAPTNSPSLEELWMPFTANRAFKRTPRMLVAAKDMHYTTADGRQILDGTAGLWCVNAGHCRERITAAIREQAGTLDYAPPFNLGHPLAFELAHKLVQMLPDGIDHVFFGNSGSEAVDTALKIALAYWQSKGQPNRVRFISRARGYHGVGFGGTAVGGIEANRKQFGNLPPHVDHIPHTHDLSRNAFSRGLPEHGVELADTLEAAIAKHGAETIAAFIVEPVAGSTGVLIPPKGYLERIRQICDRHGILLIFDEVITGFGRLGAPFAATRFGVTPDLLTLAKGITNATVPMGAVCVRHEIYDTVVNGAGGAGVELFHGYTYSGHPLAAAAGLATLSVYEEEGLFERAASLESYWADAVHSLRGTPNVIDLRNIGLVAAIELEPRAGAPGARAFEAFTKAFDEGLMIRTTGDTIALSPPLIVQRKQIDQMFETVGKVLRSVS
jgi:beta-alanine--pyruvate transaminase